MKRFEALDAFRGMTIFFMIIVNTPGDWRVTLSPLLHAQWHGFTPTDLVFPSFLFAVGNALVFANRKWEGRPFGAYFGKVFRRTVILFLLGYFMYWIPFYKWADTGSLIPIHISETRILGVLQRIALCYFAAALMARFLSERALWAWSAAILLAYWLILSAFGDYTLEGNAALKLDRFLLGEKHLYMGEGVPFDPEGLLSTLPSIVNVLAGYLFGAYLVRGEIDYEKLAKTMLVGLALLLAAYLWDFGFPVNKKLWTSSYVLLTVGLDLLVMAAILYTTNLAARKVNYQFFLILGMNALFIYLLSEYLAIFMHFIRVEEGVSLFQYTYRTGFEWMGPYIGSLAFALAFTMVCWAAGWWLWRKGVYIKV
ncbi:MAG: hypothetical protein J5I98_34565 [Phaeodactylibacter sp.]|nr:hypothetical protein [Phaeodactylibacter sp.]